MSQEVFEGDKFQNFTATATVRATAGNLLGILVASSSSGTVKVVAGANTVVNTMAVTEGVFYPMPCKWVGALVITVTGTLDATVFYKS